MSNLLKLNDLSNETSKYITGLRDHFIEKFEILAETTIEDYTINHKTMTFSMNRQDMLNTISCEIKRLDTIIANRA